MHINDFKRKHNVQKASNFNGQSTEMKLNNPEIKKPEIKGVYGQGGIDVKDGFFDGDWACTKCNAHSFIPFIPGPCPRNNGGPHIMRKRQ